MAGPEEAEEVRRRIRAFIRAHHPDHGGDPEHFAAGLDQLRAELAALTGQPPPRSRVTVTPRQGPLGALRAAVRRRHQPPRVR